MPIPSEYLSLTLRDLLRIYTGPDAQPCPPELQGWLEAAELAEDVDASRRENEAREAPTQGPVATIELAAKGSIR